MSLTFFTGLYIYKSYDPYSDGKFKTILQLKVDDKGNLYMEILNGFLRGFGFDIVGKELENNFISIRQFLDRAIYVGLNAVRLKDDSEDEIDMNFTGWVDEETGNIEKYNTLSDKKLQIILYRDEYNMLMYYDSNIKKLELDETFHLRFINSKYVNRNWVAFEDYRGINFYDDKDEVMQDLYSIEGVVSKQMILK